ncbi:MAG: hypothetical protein AAB373_03910 [Patescibacteria group bacterium]
MSVTKPSEEVEVVRVEEIAPDAVSKGVKDEVKGVAGAEAIEAEPKLRLTVKAKCKSDGQYVGLSKAQRDKLGVNVGDAVELKDVDGKIIGVRTVGLGLKELAGVPESFSANDVEIGTVVDVVKPRTIENKALKLPLQFGAENDEKHDRRSSIIGTRFPKYKKGEYLVLPTPLQKDVTGQKDASTIASIALGEVRVGNTQMALPMVPAGSAFALTSEAAKVLGIPDNAGDQVEYFVDKDGVLIINQITKAEKSN